MPVDRRADTRRKLAAQAFGQDPTKCLQNAAHAILQRRDLRHDLGTRHQQCTHGLAVEPLHRHLAVQPTRMICARPRASLASVLLTFSDSAALAWRASTQITGRPAPFNSWNSQLDNCPLSSPIRTAWGACCFTAVAIASGVESTRPRHTILPASSMTQIEVSFRDTSRPTYWLLLDMVPLHWRCRDQYVTSPAITPCPDPAAAPRRRAQELSRLAVAPTFRHASPLPGHPLTASSTTARSVRSG